MCLIINYVFYYPSMHILLCSCIYCPITFWQSFPNDLFSETRVVSFSFSIGFMYVLSTFSIFIVLQLTWFSYFFRRSYFLYCDSFIFFSFWWAIFLYIYIYTHIYGTSQNLWSIQECLECEVKETCIQQIILFMKITNFKNTIFWLSVFHESFKLIKLKNVFLFLSLK